MQYSLDDPRAYPRTYRLRGSMIAFYIFVGFVGFFLSITTIGLAKIHPTVPNETARHTSVVFAIISALFGVLPIIDALRYRFILRFDRVELYTHFRHRTVLRDNLAYIDWLLFDKTLKRVGTRPALIRKDKRSSPLFFPDMIKTDEFFDRWFAAFRNRSPDIDRD